MWRGGGLSISRYKCRVVWRGGGSCITKHSEIYAASEGRGVALGGSRNVPRSVSCSFNAYIGTPISNCSYVYSFLAVTFPSISRKVARYLGQCGESRIFFSSVDAKKSSRKCCYSLTLPGSSGLLASDGLLEGELNGPGLRVQEVQ